MNIFVIKRGFSVLRSRDCVPRYVLNRNASMCSSIDITQEWSKQPVHNFPKVETNLNPNKSIEEKCIVVQSRRIPWSNKCKVRHATPGGNAQMRNRARKPET